MFGSRSKRNSHAPSRAAKAASEAQRIAKIPAGRTGQSRVEEELLVCGTNGNEIESWRILKIMAELVDGFELLRHYDLAATIYGTARCQFGDAVYAQAEELAGRLATEGFAVITGGGDGVMGAANRGAKAAGGQSIGLNIELPMEQQLNTHTTDSATFHYFFTRKVMLAFASEVYIFFPGGFGTLDEVFEILMLVQTKKIKPLPIILFDHEYWAPLVEWFEQTLYAQYQAIDKEDMDIYHMVDTVDEAMRVVKKYVKY